MTGQAACLRERLRALGLVQFDCAADGTMLDDRPRDADWLADLVCRPAIIRRALNDAARSWEGCPEPPAFEAVPGLWLAAMPPASEGPSGVRSVVALPTAALLDSEHLAAMCQGAELDEATIRRRLRMSRPIAVEDVGRVIGLVRLTHREHRSAEQNASVIESVSQELAGSYENISFLYNISQNMSVVERPEMFISIVCEELLATVPYAWVAIALATDDAPLKELAGSFHFRGSAREPSARLHELALDLLGEKPRNTIVLEPGLSPQSDRYGDLGQTALVQPILGSEGPVGLVLAGDKQGEDAVASSVDIKLLEATAGYISIFLENASLYDDLNAMFLGTLQAVTASIDAKDQYTCGHSERVAHLTMQLARAAGLDEDTVARTHIAGLVHDVGKIGVPERVLLKPGRLTEDEFAWIRRHPEIGHGILKDIPQFEDILPGVLHHHERWDGGGYPGGLAGEEIPRLGRLIALADSFDAMSSTRTYRAEMDRADVLTEIARCAGTQFDPALAAIFVELDFTEFDRLMGAHRKRAQQPVDDLLRPGVAHTSRLPTIDT